jgi:hypothetical protein
LLKFQRQPKKPPPTSSFREATHSAKAPSVRRKELLFIGVLWRNVASDRSSRRKSKLKTHWCFKARREA